MRLRLVLYARAHIAGMALDIERKLGIGTHKLGNHAYIISIGQ